MKTLVLAAMTNVVDELHWHCTVQLAHVCSRRCRRSSLCSWRQGC